MRFAKTLIYIFLEIVTSIFIQISRPIGWFSERKPVDPVETETKTPILLIHGYLQSRSSFFVLKRRLRRDGWKRVYAIDLNPPWAGIPYFGKLVKEKTQKIILETGASKIDIISHSMGGLTARYFVKNLGGSALVNRCICLGTPHRGTRIAWLSFGKCGRQMVPRSSFLVNLNSGYELSDSVSYISIYSPHDEIVFPRTSAILPAPAKNRKIDCPGHVSLLLSLRCYKAIKESLEI